jgi:hypothetical protein
MRSTTRSHLLFRASSPSARRVPCRPRLLLWRLHLLNTASLPDLHLQGALELHPSISAEAAVSPYKASPSRLPMVVSPVVTTSTASSVRPASQPLRPLTSMSLTTTHTVNTIITNSTTLCVPTATVVSKDLTSRPNKARSSTLAVSPALTARNRSAMITSRLLARSTASSTPSLLRNVKKDSDPRETWREEQHVSWSCKHDHSSYAYQQCPTCVKLRTTEREPCTNLFHLCRSLRLYTDHGPNLYLHPGHIYPSATFLSFALTILVYFGDTHNFIVYTFLHSMPGYGRRAALTALHKIY